MVIEKSQISRCTILLYIWCYYRLPTNVWRNENVVQKIAIRLYTGRRIRSLEYRTDKSDSSPKPNTARSRMRQRIPQRPKLVLLLLLARRLLQPD